MTKKLLLLVAFLFTLNNYAQFTDPIPADNWALTQVGANNLLNNPYDIEIAPDGYLWVSERTTGKIFRINATTGVKDELVTITNMFTNAQQDGLMGFVLHPQFGQNTNNDFVYVIYTYDSAARKQRISRFTYSITANDGVLSNETVLLSGLPASNDHNSGRATIGPDLKLYWTVGDQGNNQYANYCTPIGAQILPTTTTDYANYVGKILRINLDGSIPTDNPVFGGIKSHVYTIGHRNAQGLAFANNGKLYVSEHGPRTDDEINIIESGKNYGWPHIAGYNDNKSYQYCNWSTLANCSATTFTENTCPAGVTSLQESAWAVPTNYADPIITWGTVNTGYDFTAGCGFVCWPTVAPCGIDIYEDTKIPNWNNSVLVTALKRGRIYRTKLNPAGTAVLPIADPETDGTNDDFEELWYSQNRYRDIIAAPDGLTFYIITDSNGSTSGPSNTNSIAIQNPGIIIKATYTGPLNSNSYVSNAFSIAPNPANNYIQINSSLNVDTANITITDINGRTIVNHNNYNLNQPINLDNVTHGLYFISVSVDNVTNVLKLIKE